MAATATRLSMKTEVEIDEASKSATFSIWLNNESEAYSIRIEPLTAEQREDWEDEGYTYAIRDGYSEDGYYTSFAAALSDAWRFYQDTQSQNVDEASE